MALLVCGIEALGLIGTRFALRGPFWRGIDHLNGNFGVLGWCIVALFLAAWLGSIVVYRVGGWHRLEAQT